MATVKHRTIIAEMKATIETMRSQYTDLFLDHQRAEARVIATEEDWKKRQNEARELLAKKDAHIEDCHRAVEQAEAKLAALTARRCCVRLSA